MKRNFIVVIAILLFYLQSCSIHLIGLKTDYFRLSDIERDLVVFVPESKSIASVKNNGKIYAITGDQLKDVLKDIEKSVVYLWSPHCCGEACIPLSLAEDFCEDNGYSLFIVADYYDMEKMLQQNRDIKNPIFIANERYYGTEYANRCQKLFIRDLTGEKKCPKEDKFMSFYLFEKDKKVKAVQLISELKN